MSFRHLALVGAVLAVLASPAAAQSRTSQLHDALKLTPAQEPAWHAFLAASEPSPQQEAQAQATARLAPTLPTPRRLALARSQMQADLAAFDRTVQAVTAFYNQLSPVQQAAFDRETRSEPSAPPPPRR
jgi:hypothetical protein